MQPIDNNVTVVLADDHEIVREGFALICEESGFRILGQCADGATAVDMVMSLKPTLAVLDLEMPKLTGIDVIRQLRARGSGAKLMILSISREDQRVMEALRAGADAYILKDGPKRHLIDAIAFVQDGGVYISPLLRGVGIFTRAAAAAQEDPLAVLSPRELEVFAHLVNGLRAKDIAGLLQISPKTVDTYRASLMRKLQVRDLVSLVKFAIERNLTSTSPTR
jgi:DNA-binding NarL/FixJ family response regulator